MSDFQRRGDSPADHMPSDSGLAVPPEEEAEPLVRPTELDSFQRVSDAIAKARRMADAITEISDRSHASAAADALKALRIARQDAEKARQEEGRPFSEAKASVDSAFKEAQSSVKAAEQSLKDRLLEFEREERQAHEEERKRQEKLARERQAREDKKAEAEGRRSVHKPAPPPAPAPPKGARGDFAKTVTREVTKYEITNEAELPDEYLTKTPNRRKIKAAVEAGLVVPGTRVWKEEEVATR